MVDLYRICIINQYAGHPLHGMEYRPFFISKELKAKGYDTLIITSSFSHLRRNQFNLKWYQLFSFKTIDGVSYLIIRNIRYKKNGVRRALGLLIFSIQSFLAVALLRSHDIYIASSTHTLDFFPLVFVKTFYLRSRIIFEPHDLWPLTLTAGGFLSKKNPFVKLLQYGEDWFCRNSDAVISMHPLNNIHLESRGLLPGSFFHIPNGISVSEFRSYEDCNFTLDDSITDFVKSFDFVIVYAGSISDSNGFLQLIDCARLCQTMKLNFGFIFFGGGNKLDVFKSKINNMRNVYYGGSVPRSYLASIYALVDVGFCGFIHSPLYAYGISPNKIWEYMYYKLPILLMVDSPNDPVSESQCGLTVTTYDPIDLVTALEKLFLLKQNSQLEQMGNNGFRHVIRNNTYDVISNSFITVFKHVFDGKRS